MISFSSASTLFAAVAAVLVLAGCFGPANLSDEQVFPEAFIAARRNQDELLAAGQGLEALTAAREMLDRDRSAACLTLAARVEDDPRRALSLLDDALDQDPDFVWARYGFAFIVLKEETSDRYEESVEHLLWLHDRGFVRERNAEVRTRRLLIENLSRLGRSLESIGVVEEILAIRPDDREMRFLLAWLLCIKRKDPEEALIHLDRILVDDSAAADPEADGPATGGPAANAPEILEAKRLKGRALVEAERYRAAAAYYETFADLHPNALLNLGLLHEFHLDDPAKALGYYRRFRAYEGDHADERRFYDLKFLVPTRIEALKKTEASGGDGGGGREGGGRP
jgi:tetratricopeptide (TPR) repeat protein